jgi:protein-S-isoprenylcysteine O-methyltransferase Ste14
MYYKLRYRVFLERGLFRNEGIGLILFRWILGLPLLFSTFVYIFVPGYMEIFYIHLPSAMRVAGATLGFLSLALLGWVHYVLGGNFSTSINVDDGHVDDHHHLITSGPYRYVRHPMYVAYFVLFIAVFLVSENWLLGVSGCGIILSLMTFRRRKEEAFLLEKYKDHYKEYMEKTPKFLPKMSK